MLNVLQVEQQVVEQDRQHEAIIGCLSSAELLLRQQVKVFCDSKFRLQQLPQPHGGVKKSSGLVEEIIDKNDLLIKEIYERIDALRIATYNLININRIDY